MCQTSVHSMILTHKVDIDKYVEIYYVIIFLSIKTIYCHVSWDIINVIINTIEDWIED